MRKNKVVRRVSLCALPLVLERGSEGEAREKNERKSRLVRFRVLSVATYRTAVTERNLVL